MEPLHQQLSLNDMNNEQEKRSRDLLEKSRELLKHLKQSVKKTEELNEKALNYLNDSVTSSIADNINFASKNAPEQEV